MRSVYLLSVAAVALLFSACNTELNGDWNEWMDNVPGLEQQTDPKTGKSYTSYMGHAMPESEYSKERMEEVLALIASQKDEIDDNFFVEQLTSNLFSSEIVFRAQVKESTKLPWFSTFDYVGITLGGTIRAEEDGTHYARYSPGCAEIGLREYLAEMGYEGYYVEYEWEYNAELNTLISRFTSGTKSMVAELLYFDGEQAVMLGQIAGITDTSTWYDTMNTRLETAYELIHLQFIDGRDTFLDGYVASDRYLEDRYTYEQIERLKNINTEMSAVMQRYSDYNVDLLAQELCKGKWREWSQLKYNDEWTEVIEAPAWHGLWEVAGGIFGDYSFNADGSGWEFFDIVDPGEEDLTYTFEWTYDKQTKTLTRTYENSNAKHLMVKVSAYWDDIEIEGKQVSLMAWDYDEHHTRIVLCREK